MVGFAFRRPARAVRRLLSLGLLLGFLGLGWSVLGASRSSPALRGPVETVLDGDTLVLAGETIRLQGIAAPELNEPLGPEAREAVRRMVAGRTVECVPDGTRSRGRIVALCRVGGEDIGARLVASGLARDCPRYSNGRYGALEREAERRGAAIRRRYDLPAYCLPRR
ncbi:MAG: thermonuclease family protein [Geminicoccaceae bacterium]|nr:thermonuclease family protein [Geminicoccaceae bacterium]MCX7630057.1 thermonuclease family protein [Geminicoccaceae bacterium]MDW8123492.1 thermonuclease family protein [Geminicoccaceae bacterium]